jgi:ATP-dependent Clp protease ATP-binding subunit ClpX
MFDLPGNNDIDEVIIDKDVAESRKDPVLVYAQKDKEAAGDAA